MKQNNKQQRRLKMVRDVLKLNSIGALYLFYNEAMITTKQVAGCCRFVQL
jgi:hypothetical protein